MIPPPFPFPLSPHVAAVSSSAALAGTFGTRSLYVAQQYIGDVLLLFIWMTRYLRCRVVFVAGRPNVIRTPPKNQKKRAPLLAMRPGIWGLGSPATHWSHIAHDGHPDLCCCNGCSFDPTAPAAPQSTPTGPDSPSRSIRGQPGIQCTGSAARHGRQALVRGSTGVFGVTAAAS